MQGGDVGGNEDEDRFGEAAGGGEVHVWVDVGGEKGGD